MSADDLKSLPAPARKYIRQLESRIARLEKDLARSQALAPKCAATGLAEARGEALKVRWAAEGVLVPAKVLAETWGLTPQALGPAETRGEIFSITVKRARHYPVEFLHLNRETIATVCQALGDLSPAEKLVFWKRPHGVLKGLTVIQTLHDRETPEHVSSVVELAQAWVLEASDPAVGVG